MRLARSLEPYQISTLSLISRCIQRWNVTYHTHPILVFARGLQEKNLDVLNKGPTQDVFSDHLNYNNKSIPPPLLVILIHGNIPTLIYHYRPLPCTSTTGPSYPFLPLTQYIPRLKTATPRKSTTLQLKDSRSTGVVFGQKDQKKHQRTNTKPLTFTGTPIRPRLQYALGNTSGW